MNHFLPGLGASQFTARYHLYTSPVDVLLCTLNTLKLGNVWGFFNSLTWQALLLVGFRILPVRVLVCLSVVKSIKRTPEESVLNCRSPQDSSRCSLPGRILKKIQLFNQSVGRGAWLPNTFLESSPSPSWKAIRLRIIANVHAQNRVQRE